jgi:hypothetical protein
MQYSEADEKMQYSEADEKGALSLGCESAFFVCISTRSVRNERNIEKLFSKITSIGDPAL